jgi:hypothetical protein
LIYRRIDMGESDKSKPTTPREGIKPPPGRRQRIEEIHERIQKKAPDIGDTLKPPPDPKKSA